MRPPRHAAGAAVALVLAASALVGCGSVGSSACTTDPLVTRSLAGLTGFSDWLRTHGASGTVGEVGWPEGDQWGALADRWYQQADTDQVGVFAWAAAQWWPEDYPMAVYRTDDTGQVVAGAQAAVVAGHPAAPGVTRGVALADATFGASLDDGASYSSTAPGVPGTDYEYPSAAELDALAADGVTQVRLGVTWERLQPALDGPLADGELARLTATLDAARDRGLAVVLDLHSYGRYARGDGDGGREVLLLGSDALPAAALADLWRRLAGALAGRPEVVGYGLMNEPHDLPGGARGWEADSVAAARAVREVDPSTPLLVGGYDYSGIDGFGTTHPQPWVDPALGPVVYEAHQYFDSTGAGTYTQDYDATVADAVAAGWGPCSAPAAG
ncbi:hypothetical protein GCM10027047_31310 [Rhodococcus aerolatus]